ncbi:MAG: basic amino acid ABC transporter substrate-binding protein [Elusimicrobia bacterium CG_4_10_14_0_8_um_filter_37_32]|nr:MAG: basic amino acid ABC transporter substrate-binding protein [Elusimicrobia bacterium CG02_land_8_20_14_3_00_37_13]PIZ13219.1 MAG: basic amino acid ABC transporter substrate-binding protein [Elusimicrobia bacterium CG_4_10_14_0_8_um_filter_37_32]
MLFFSPNKFDNPADKLGNPVATQSVRDALLDIKEVIFVKNVFGLFLCLLFLCACSRTNDTNILKIGTDATYPPFEIIDTTTGELVGFDIDLMKEICKEISKKPEFIIVPFDGIIAGLKQKKYDAIISAMTITDERSKEVGFSKPYFLAGQSIVVREDNNSIKSLNDLINKKIGVQLGTTGEIEAKKILNVVVVSYDNISAAFIDLKNGRIDAIINDIPTNRLIVNQKGKMKIVGEPLTKECYGIAVRQEDKKLLELINCTLDKIQKNGIQRKLYRKWQIE